MYDKELDGVLITGGAGFIGSNLTQKFIQMGYRVICVDNFEIGSIANLGEIKNHHNFKLYHDDVTDTDRLNDIISENHVDMVYHLAANSDIQKGGKEPKIDFKNTFYTTYSVLEAMRKNQVNKLFFSSTSAVYGERVEGNLREDMGGLTPISYYGGAKLASEAYLSAYAAMNNMNITIFRFANVIGPNLTHGVIFDFINKLKNNPKELEILGDGKQNKPYIFVDDLTEAILQTTIRDGQGFNIYNAGVETTVSVREIADLVCRRMNLKDVLYRYTGGDRGWKGDVPSFQYDLSKIHALGWRAKRTSKEAVQETLNSISTSIITNK